MGHGREVSLGTVCARFSGRFRSAVSCAGDDGRLSGRTPYRHHPNSRPTTGDNAIRRLMLSAIWFLVGAVVAATPFVVRGHLLHLEEAARGEPTMGPGWSTFLGLLAAPVGGTVAVVIYWWIQRRRRSD